MNFLGAVAAFLAMIWLAQYLFVTMDNTLLGLASLAMIGIGFFLLVLTAKEDS